MKSHDRLLSIKYILFIWDQSISNFILPLTVDSQFFKKYILSVFHWNAFVYNVCEVRNLLTKLSSF